MYNVFPRGMIRVPLQKQEFYEKGYDELIKDKVFMEQLLVASPSLYHSVKNIDKCNEKKKQKVKIIRPRLKVSKSQAIKAILFLAT